MLKTENIEDYTIYCSQDQCEKAITLGANIPKVANSIDGSFEYRCTAEQMIGFLEAEYCIAIHVIRDDGYYKVSAWYYDHEVTQHINNFIEFFNQCNDNRNDVILAAIDATLDRLI